VAGAGAQGLGRRRATARVIGSSSLPGLGEALRPGSWPALVSMRLRLVSPLRLKRQGALVRRFDLPALARDLSLRLAALGYYHGGLPWPAPWSEALAQAERVPVRQDATRWVEGVRYSARQAREIVVGGLMGEVWIDSFGAELQQLLVVGSVIHAGKGTSMGLGQIEVELERGEELRAVSPWRASAPSDRSEES
jgi:hypothetical protein